MASLLRRNPELVGRYALPPSSIRLRREIARRAMDLGIHISAEDVTLTHGCIEALQLALQRTGAIACEMSGISAGVA